MNSYGRWHFSTIAEIFRSGFTRTLFLKFLSNGRFRPNVPVTALA